MGYQNLSKLILLISSAVTLAGCGSGFKSTSQAEAAASPTSEQKIPDQSEIEPAAEPAKLPPTTVASVPTPVPAAPAPVTATQPAAVAPKPAPQKPAPQKPTAAAAPKPVTLSPAWTAQPLTVPPLLRAPNASAQASAPRPPLAARPASLEAVWGPLEALPIPAWMKSNQGEVWSLMTIKALRELGQNLLATSLSDTGDFCPKYNSLATNDRAKVWLQIISAVSFFESSLKPWDSYVEKMFNSKHEQVVSRGLMQISSESANYSGCGIQTEAQLLDPETNLRCSVRILNRLITQDHRLRGKTTNGKAVTWYGASRYWSTLRGNKKDATIRAAVLKMSQCG